MAKIAILGFGTVGSGVYEVLCRNAAASPAAQANRWRSSISWTEGFFEPPGSLSVRQEL